MNQIDVWEKAHAHFILQTHTLYTYLFATWYYAWVKIKSYIDPYQRQSNYSVEIEQKYTENTFWLGKLIEVNQKKKIENPKA